MHMDEISMRHIGRWLSNHLVRSVTRLDEAKDRLEACGVDLDVLRSSWKAQVAAQSKPLPGTPCCSCVHLLDY